jgi:hypothetical protein
MTEDDAPLPLMARVLVAVDRGDYERAAQAQARLRELGWNLAPVPNDPPRAPRRSQRGREDARG